ncbi:unnamed protein product [Clavelina lepadiformis]|uniref:Uncharacterized protein n=1 Tax=Clavelina lepadiformis TaxID=159417 RepID=A0ABP0EY84_CLALP
MTGRPEFSLNSGKVGADPPLVVLRDIDNTPPPPGLGEGGASSLKPALGFKIALRRELLKN